jgi:glycosyltransferase involved in cell wall biosynthesis
VKNNSIYLLTIITVNYNNRIGLEKTIDSIKLQEGVNIELIVVDGGSSDDSALVLKHNSGFIHQCISEPDKGIYDAMNKGLALATGKYVLFLNSGDILPDSNIIKLYAKKINCCEDKVIFSRAKVSSKSQEWLYPDINVVQGNFKIWLGRNEPNHQAMLFPQKFYLENNYNLDYNIAADLEFKLRAIAHSGIDFIDIIGAEFELGGTSSNYESLKITLTIAKEVVTIRKLHQSISYVESAFIYSKFLIKYLAQKLGKNRLYSLMRIFNRLKSLLLTR